MSLGTMPAGAEPDAAADRLTVIAPGLAARNYWRDLWHYRELFAILAWRDVTVRYKQTVVGVLWALVRPLLTMIVFTVVFGRLAGLPSDGGVPYPVMVMAGMLPWFLFSTILGSASNSIVSNGNLISKVYFPRLIVPLSACAVALVDSAITFVLLVGLMLSYGVAPDWRIVFLPGFVLLAVLASVGPALILTALNIRYRDFGFIVPFIIQFGMYVSPVGFSSAVVPEEWRLLYSINPVVGVIDGFRWSLLGGDTAIHWPGFALGCLLVLALLWAGIRTFRATERTFADLI
ncbi:ABC transporter permease [Prosthecomicrobium pneumaticum]|uniref:Transport permease protein n=1 Tax=Prosthecomicrobium pneumaticum TaxID=81895 RepID=A0A7W9FKY5_9HYPH|nr:ABC transporter permease [Prosthecomicrobium pneumaticum]MBB5751888.1 lipopolysaccharide transport system permease protein [Prosthecomicrobium pneumaticum]